LKFGHFGTSDDWGCYRGIGLGGTGQLPSAVPVLKLPI